jgi:hypothetical protein
MWRIKHVYHRPRPFSPFWSLILAIPFYFLWNALAPTYLPSLPPLYQHFTFWHSVGLFGLVAVMRVGLLGW